MVGFLHADDFYENEKILSDIANEFSSSKTQGVYGDLVYVSDFNKNTVIRRWRTKKFSLKRLKNGWMPPHPTLYVRTNWYKAINGFNLDYSISADYDSILKLFTKPDFITSYIPKVLVKMRIGGASNKSFKNIVLKLKEDKAIISKSGIGGINTLLAKNFRKIDQFFT